MQNKCTETTKRLQEDKIEKWINSPKNFLVLIGGIKKENCLNFMNNISNYAVIFVDNFESSYETDLRRSVLFESVDIRYSSQEPTIIMSNLNEKEIYKIYGEKISSRIFAIENTIIDFFDC